MNATTKLESTALTVVERAALALGTTKLEGDLRTLATKHADIKVIKDKAGREQCHSAMMDLQNTRTAITKTGKTARDDANAFAKAVISEEGRLIAIIEPEEKRLRSLRDGWDDAREAEAAAARERADTDHAAFLRTGPGADAIVSAVAEHFDVMEADALRWITTYTFAPMEQAA